MGLLIILIRFILFWFDFLQIIFLGLFGFGIRGLKSIFAREI